MTSRGRTGYRFLCAIAGFISGIVATGHSFAQEQRFDGVTLTVATFGGPWSGEIGNVVGKEFERRGGKLQFEIGNSRTFLAKLIAARGDSVPFDVVEITDATWPEYQAADLIQKMNLANIPNKRDLDPSMYDEFKVADWITEEGIVYNIAKFKELGIPRPEKFSDLLNPKLKNRVSVPDISVNIALNCIVGFAAEAGGSEKNIDPGLEAIKKLNVFNFWKAGPEVPQLMKSGDIWAAVTHGGWAVQMAASGLPVGMVHPKIGDRQGMASRGFVGIVKGSNKAAAAEFYINQLISAESQEHMYRTNGSISVNAKAQLKASDTPVKDSEGRAFLLLTPQQINNMYNIDYAGFKLTDWSRKWNRIMSQ